MSTWTDEKHDEARVLADYYDHPREISFMEGEAPPWEHLAITLGSALDEIERLRAEADAPAPDPGVEFAEWVMEFVPSDRQDEAWREFTRSKVRVCLGDHKTEGQLREEIETFKRGMADRAAEDQR